jgi:hypothetical protein
MTNQENYFDAVKRYQNALITGTPIHELFRLEKKIKEAQEALERDLEERR